MESAHAAKVICRSMGYAHGSVSSSPCRFYGGADLCGAAGSPVVRFCDLVAPGRGLKSEHIVYCRRWQI